MPKTLVKIRACRPCIKPDPAVNGKRRIQTFFVILKCMLCILFVSFLQKRLFFKNRLNQTKKNKFWSLSYSWAALGVLLAAFGALLAALESLLGRFWPLLAALGRSWAALGPLLAALGRLLGRSWALWGRSWPLLAALGPLLERHAKIIANIYAKNVRFGPPKRATKWS